VARAATRKYVVIRAGLRCEAQGCARIATGTTAGGSADTGIHHHIPSAVVDCSATRAAQRGGPLAETTPQTGSLGQPYFQGAGRPGAPVTPRSSGLSDVSSNFFG
jgi:hypothetical protein